jgi:hypothetical protein
MIRGLGAETTSTYSQTLNGQDGRIVPARAMSVRKKDASAKWATFGKQNWRCGMNQKPGYGARCRTLMRPHERCWLLKTAGRWPWKSELAKECVTTHLPKQLALKMDGAEASGLHPAAGRREQ